MWGVMWHKVGHMKINNYFNTPKSKLGFDSKFEESKYHELVFRMKAKDIKEFWCQYPLDLIVNGYLVGKYVMDFVILHNDKTIELFEVKGLPTQLWAYKYRILKAMYANHKNVIITVEYQKSWSKKVHKEPIPKKLPKNYKPQF